MHFTISCNWLSAINNNCWCWFCCCYCCCCIFSFCCKFQRCQSFVNLALHQMNIDWSSHWIFFLYFNSLYMQIILHSHVIRTYMQLLYVCMCACIYLLISVNWNSCASSANSFICKMSGNVIIVINTNRASQFFISFQAHKSSTCRISAYRHRVCHVR